MPELTQAAAIREATVQAMRSDPSVCVLGEGVCDPKGVFGTTLGLRDEFGPKRVMETPLSENAFTGIATGMALHGMRPIVTHQRVDFALLSLDQLVNNAAKWHFMFGGIASVPLVVRMVVGRGWGQGPQHAQSLQALFAHIDGLKVVMPALAAEGGGLLLAALDDPNPVIFIEHRWCHSTVGEVPKPLVPTPIGTAETVRAGTDVTIAACSYMVLEALEAATRLAPHEVSCEVINLRSIRPWDVAAVCASVQRTGHLVVADTGPIQFGVAAEISATVCENCWDSLAKGPARIACPAYPSPSSPHLAAVYYPGAQEIATACLRQLDALDRATELRWPELHPFELDRPNPSFRGPF